MKKRKELMHVWKEVFTNKKYLALTIAIAFLFYLTNGAIISLTDINSSFHTLGFEPSFKFLLSSSLNFGSEVKHFTVLTTIVLGLLIGILVSLLFYRLNKVKTAEIEKGGFLGTMGVFLGAAAPGCAACGVGVMGLLGLSSALAIPPFGGHEITILAIGIMVFSVCDLPGKHYNPLCELKLNKNTQKLKGGNN